MSWYHRLEALHALRATGALREDLTGRLEAMQFTRDESAPLVDFEAYAVLRALAILQEAK